MGWLTFIKEAVANVPTPAAGKSRLFVDTDTGEPSYKDDAGIVHSLKGTGFTVNGRVATYADLPSGLTSADAGKAYVVDADSLAYIWDGTAFPADGAGEALTGPAGANGDPAHTNTTAGYVQPAEGANVALSVVSTAWMAVGETVYIASGGSYSVVSIGDAVTATVMSIVGAGNTAAGSMIASGALVTPSGKQGPQGVQGAAGTDGANGNLITSLNAQTGTTYTLALTDQNANVRCTNAAAVVVTIPTNATVPFPLNAVAYISQGGAGAVSVVGATSVTVNNSNNAATAGKGDYIAVVKVGTDEWDVI